MYQKYQKTIDEDALHIKKYYLLKKILLKTIGVQSFVQLSSNIEHTAGFQSDSKGSKTVLSEMNLIIGEPSS